MRNILKAAMLAAVLVTGVAGPAEAQRRQEYVIVYYTDATYSTIAGQRVVYCDGGSTRVGTATEYEQEIYYGCN